MRIGIVGGGIGGLASAIALRRVGFDTVVFEQAPKFGVVGAGIVLAPNTMRALDWLGAGDTIRAINGPVEASTYSDITSGEEIFRTVLGDRAAERFGAHLYTTHRRDLVAALADCLPDTALRLGQQVTRVDENADHVRVELADGTAEALDLLVGADGLKSSMRTYLFGEEEAIFTGYLAWRTTFPAERLGKQPPPHTMLWGGAGRHVVRYPIRKGAEIYTAFYVPAEEIHRETWDVSGDIGDLRASFENSCPEVRDTLACIDQAFITGIYYRQPLPKWHSRRIVLTGDAAHSVLPTSGSGSGLALEDAITLALCVARSPGHALEAAFAEFQERRWDRATRIQVASRVDLDAFHEADPGRIAARYGRYRGVAQIDPLGELRWSGIYTYDAANAAEIPIDDLRGVESVGRPPARAEARRAFEMWRGAISIEESARGWHGQREGYDRFVRGLGAVPDDVLVESVDCNGVSALRLTPPGADPGKCLVHLHGGGFVLGSAAAAASVAERLARAAGTWALVPDYRLAPEHAYPAALDDVRAVWDWLTATAIDDVYVSGECTGGGLALSLALSLQRSGQKMPEMLALFSPFLDPLVGSSSIDSNAACDPWMSRVKATEFAASYLQGNDPADPLLSPLYADLTGLPPLRIWSATSEALHADAKLLAERTLAAGVDAHLECVADSVPSFVLFDFLPEGRAAIDAFCVAIRTIGDCRVRTVAEQVMPRTMLSARDEQF